MMRLLQSLRIQRAVKIQRCSFIAIPKIARGKKRRSTDGIINQGIFFRYASLIAKIATIRFNRKELSPSKCMPSSRDNARIIGNRRPIS